MMSKMGISTVSCYRGAQAFEAIGLAAELVEQHFTGTPARLGGAGLDGPGARGARRATRAPTAARHASALPGGGLYRYARDGERHGWNPDASRACSARIRERRRRGSSYSAGVDERAAAALRDLLELRARPATPIPLEEVEPAEAIVRALRDRRDVARRDLARGARDARDRDEPPRRALEHRRGRRGPARATRRPDGDRALDDQADRLGRASA